MDGNGTYRFMAKHHKRTKKKMILGDMTGKTASAGGKGVPSPSPQPVPAADFATLANQALKAFNRQEWSTVVNLAKRYASPAPAGRRAGAGGGTSGGTGPDAGPGAGEEGAPTISAQTQFWAGIAAEAHFRQALDYLREGRPRAVIAELTNATKWMPDDGIYLYHLGLAHHRLGYWQDALAAYEKAWQVAPSWRVAYHQALAAIQSGPEILAAQWEVLWNRLQSTAPKKAAGRVALARLAAWAKCTINRQPLDLVIDWERAHQLPPLVKLEAGLFCLVTGKHKTAAALIEKALAADQDLPLSYRLAATGAQYLAEFLTWQGSGSEKTPRAKVKGINIGAWTARVGELTQAVLDKSSRHEDPNIEEGLNCLYRLLWHAGWLAWKAGLVDAAGAAWSLAHGDDKDNLHRLPPEVLHNLALFKEKTAEDVESMEYWESYAESLRNKGQAKAALTLGMDRYTAEQMAIQVYLHLCRIAMQIDADIKEEWLLNIINNRHADPLDRLETAEVAASAREAQLVRRALLPIQHQIVTDPELLRRAALIYNQAEMEKEELAAWEQLYRLTPDDQKVRTALAAAYVTKGERELSAAAGKNRERAREIFREALQLDPENLDGQAYLACCYLLNGDKSAAQAQIDKLITNNNIQPAGALFRFGKILCGFTQLREIGLSYVKKALKLDGSGNAYAQAADICFASGFVNEGRRFARRAIKEWHYQLDASLGFVRYLFVNGNLDIALELAKTLYRHHPDSSQLCCLIYEIQLKQRDEDT